MRRALVIALLLFCLAGTKASALSMNIQTDDRERLIFLNLWGAVEAGDGEQFRQLITPYLRAGYLLYEVNVFSTGGLVAPAADIGRQIRQLGARTRGPIVLPQGNPACWFAEKAAGGISHRQVSGYGWCTCTSACVMIWIAGTTRDGNVVGIHRFSFVNRGLISLSPQDAQRAYKAAEETGLSYFRSMGLPISLGDRMMATRANEMYFLRDQELDLVRSAPFVEEYTVQLCGSYPARPIEPGGRTPVVDGTDNACVINALKTFMRQGVQDYLNEAIKVAPYTR